MQLKVTPKINARYWTVISIASMCGTNLGDFFPDVLKVGTGLAVIILAALFGLLLAIDRASRRGTEAVYWLAILVVRAAATQIADSFVSKQHLGYMLVSATLAALLLALVAFNPKSGPKDTTGGLPTTDIWYWMTMLTAGSLGTVVGDGIGHAFGPVSTGVPVSAAISTVVLAAILGLRSRLMLNRAPSYWIAIVAVRWWGTNTGDILGFLSSLVTSMLLTGAAMAIVLFFWKQSATKQEPSVTGPLV